MRRVLALIVFLIVTACAAVGGLVIGTMLSGVLYR